MNSERLDIDPERFHALEKTVEVALHPRPDEGVQDGRGKPLELAKLRQHLARDADVDVRHEPRDRLARACLMHGIAVGVEKTYGDRLDTGRFELLDHRFD